MSTARRLRRRKEHAAALAQVALWERGLQAHFHVTVRRLMMARTPRKKAEIMAFKAIVEGLSGMDRAEAYEEIARDE